MSTPPTLARETGDKTRRCQLPQHNTLSSQEKPNCGQPPEKPKQEIRQEYVSYPNTTPVKDKNHARFD